MEEEGLIFLLISGATYLTPFSKGWVGPSEMVSFFLPGLMSIISTQQNFSQGKLVTMA